MSHPRRGEIYIADLEPVLGSEQAGRRPVLIIQNDVSNQHSPVTIVACITSAPARMARPTDIVLQTGVQTGAGLTRPSRVLLNQIKTIDRRRLRGRVGEVSPTEMCEVDEAIRISLGLVPL